MVNFIPFRLQGRESLGFLASVYLGLDTRTILALNGAGGRLVRHHGCSPICEKSFYSLE